MNLIAEAASLVPVPLLPVDVLEYDLRLHPELEHILPSYTIPIWSRWLEEHQPGYLLNIVQDALRADMERYPDNPSLSGVSCGPSIMYEMAKRIIAHHKGETPCPQTTPPSVPSQPSDSQPEPSPDTPSPRPVPPT